MATREEMDETLKGTVIPHLRDLGFKGSGLHFRRERNGALDLLSFQFSRWSGSFVVEIGRVSREGVDRYGKHIAPFQAKAYHSKERHRLGSELRINYDDHWFEFEKCDPQEVAYKVRAEIDNEELWTLVDQMSVTR